MYLFVAGEARSPRRGVRGRGLTNGALLPVSTMAARRGVGVFRGGVDQVIIRNGRIASGLVEDEVVVVVLRRRPLPAACIGASSGASNAGRTRFRRWAFTGSVPARCISVQSAPVAAGRAEPLPRARPVTRLRSDCPGWALPWSSTASSGDPWPPDFPPGSSVAGTATHSARLRIPWGTTPEAPPVNIDDAGGVRKWSSIAGFPRLGKGGARGQGENRPARSIRSCESPRLGGPGASAAPRRGAEVPSNAGCAPHAPLSSCCEFG